MTIELIEKANTPEEFMARMNDCLIEAKDTESDIAITISMLHRTQDEEENVKAVLEYSLDSHDNMTLEYSISHMQVLDLIRYAKDLMSDVAPVPMFSINQIEYVLSNVFDKESMDGYDFQAQAAQVFEDADFNGLASQVRIMIEKGKRLEISLIISAEVYADTTALEMEQATALGVAHLHKPSAPERVVPICVVTAQTMDFL